VAAGTLPFHRSLLKLTGRVRRAVAAHNLTGSAAEMSYYFVLSIFPFLIFLAALVGTPPFTGAWSGVLNWILLYFPSQSQNAVLAIVLGLTQGRSAFLSVGLFGTAWAASNGLLCLMRALNLIYGVRETRSFPKRVGFAFLMVFVLATLVLSTFGLLTVANWLDQRMAAGTVGLVTAPVLWRVTRRITSIILLGASIAILDRTMPNQRPSWRRTLPGVAFTVVIWLASTSGFNLYAQHIGAFNRTYGVLGVFVILMVWIYLSSLIFLSGAEINSELWKMRSSAIPMVRPASRSSFPDFRRRRLENRHGS
jgi:membrane protein